MFKLLWFGGQSSAFPIDFAGRPYNSTLRLACECDDSSCTVQSVAHNTAHCGPSAYIKQIVNAAVSSVVVFI